MLTIYIIATGLLGLAVPLAVQALVNSIASSAVQPLVVLSLLVLIGALVAGVLNLLQLALVEGIQQRLFARSAMRIAQRLILSTSRSLAGTYGPELANRFFDVLTIQKSLAKLLLDGLAAALQAVIGLVLLALYDHRGLLAGFDLMVLLVVGFIIFPIGWGGLRTSLAESTQKYAVAGWLEELARCRPSFKLHAAPLFLFQRTEAAVGRWLYERRRHFRVTFRQELGNQLFQALASAGVLAIGGYLVVQRELTLGQLVAAQLIVAQMLKALDKLLKQAETVYDLLTGLDKTGYLYDLETEPEGGDALPPSPTGGASVTLRDVRFTYPNGHEVLVGLNLSLSPGQRISLVGQSGAGKSTLAALLSGLETPSHGLIEINGVELRGVDRNALRQVVTIAGCEETIFPGTLEENILVGRTYLRPEDLRWALGLVQLENEVVALPQGLATPLVGGGSNLSRGQVQRVLLARAIIERPELLILDEAFTGIDERTSQAILAALFAPENPWTIVDISHEGAVVTRAETVYVLAGGQIVEAGPAEALAANPESAFSQLFPELSGRLAGRGRS